MELNLRWNYNHVSPGIRISKKYRCNITEILNEGGFHNFLFENVERGACIFLDTVEERDNMLDYLTAMSIPCTPLPKHLSLQDGNSGVQMPTISTQFTSENHSNEDIPVITISKKNSNRTVRILCEGGFENFSVGNHNGDVGIYAATVKEYRSILDYLQLKQILCNVFDHKKLRSMSSPLDRRNMTSSSDSREDMVLPGIPQSFGYDSHIWPFIHVSKSFKYNMKGVIQFTLDDTRFKYVCLVSFENGISIYASTEKEHNALLRFLEKRNIPTISSFHNESPLEIENTEVHKPMKLSMITSDMPIDENIPIITVLQERGFITVQMLRDVGLEHFSVENYKGSVHIYAKTKKEFNDIVEFLQGIELKFYIWIYKQLTSGPAEFMASENLPVIVVSKKYKSRMSEILVDGGFQNFCLENFKYGVHIHAETMEEHLEIINYLEHKSISCHIPSNPAAIVKSPLHIRNNIMHADTRHSIKQENEFSRGISASQKKESILYDGAFKPISHEKLNDCATNFANKLKEYSYILNDFPNLNVSQQLPKSIPSVKVQRSEDSPVITVSKKYKSSMGKILCDGGFENFCIEFVKRKGVHIYGETVEEYFAIIKYFENKSITYNTFIKQPDNLKISPAHIETNNICLINKSAKVKSSEKGDTKDPPMITVPHKKASVIKQILKEGGFEHFQLENIKGGVHIYSKTMKQYSNIVNYLNEKTISYHFPKLQQPITWNSSVFTNQTFNPELVEIKRKKIITLSDEYNATRAIECLHKGGFKNFVVKNFFDCVRIFPLSLQEYSNILKYFHKKALTYHTFAQKGKRCYKKFLIFGIDDEEPIQTVFEALSNVPGIIDIRRLKKSSSDGKRYEISEILVTTGLVTNIEDIKKIKTIGNMVFRVEVYNEKRFLPQCFRCQKYGHTKNYCCEKIACVRCSGPHYISECPRTGKPKCFHCAGSHVASYHLCPKRLELESKMTMTKKTTGAIK